MESNSYEKTIQRFPKKLYEKAIDCLKNNDLEQYCSLLKSSADQGYIFAEFEMGNNYDFGDNSFPQDYQKAFQYYELASKHEFQTDEKNRITKYLYKDIPAYLHNSQCVFPHVNALILMGYFYERGLGVSQSYEKAFSCYLKAYEKGEKNLATAYIANCYELGQGVDKSVEKAKEFYRIFKDRFNNTPNDYEMLAAQTKDEEKRFRYLQKAFLCYKANAEFGDPDSLNRLSYCYRKGLGVQPSKELADHYVQLADKLNDAELNFIELKEKADLGDAEAQFEVANCYLSGKGTPLLTLQAKQYYILAASQGNALANYKLGFQYDFEVFEDEDHYALAAKSYRIAAEKGIGDAMIRLGYLHQYGLGVEKSPEKAVELYLKALQQDYLTFHTGIYGCALIACCYENGVGIPISSDTSRFYYKLCADLLNSKKNAQKLIEEFEQLGWDFLEMKRKRLHASERFFRCMQKAFLYEKALASYEDPEALFKLAYYYELGQGVLQSDIEAIRYYLMAIEKGSEKAKERWNSIFASGVGFIPVSPMSSVGAIKLRYNFKSYQSLADQQGDAFSQYVMGLAYKHGENVEISDQKAFEYFQKSASQNYMDAFAELGRCYDHGMGTAPSKELAVQCYLKAKDLGSVRTLYELGKAYLDGSLEYFPEAAAYYYRIGAQHGDEEAQYALGWLYAEGIGVKQSFSNAFTCFEAAAKSNHAGACNELARYYYEGIAVNQSVTKAALYYFEASNQNFPDAKTHLDECIAELIWLEDDSFEAKMTLQKVCKQKIA